MEIEREATLGALWDRYTRKATEVFEGLLKWISPAMGRQKRAQDILSTGLLPCRGFLLLVLCTLVASLVLPAGCAGREAPSNIVWHDLTLTPSEVSVGEKVLIEFWIDIRPYRGVTTDVTLKIDNKDVQTKRVHAEGNATTRVWFQITAKTVGIHKVSIGRLTGTFTVTEPE